MQRSSRWLRTCGTLLLIVLLTACAANAPRPSSSASVARSEPPPSGEEPRSSRGNPPFYDVLGKRYHVLPTSAGYRERGVASWYGPDFHGLATSSGETYDMHAMTAAHTTLPIPTWVQVTNLTNGKHVIVKVNDRGPFVDNRIIDLSYAAAIALDMVRNGTARVEVRAVAPPLEALRVAPAPATAALPPPTTAVTVMGAPRPAPPPPAAQPAPRMFVQVGAFAERGNAVRLVDRLRASGFVNPFVITDGDSRRELHRVRLGPIRDAEEFDLLSARLRTVGVADAQLVVDR
jgi:rare lipoprotein A